MYTPCSTCGTAGLQGWQFWPLIGQEHRKSIITNGFNDQLIIPGYDSLFVLWPIFSTITKALEPRTSPGNRQRCLLQLRTFTLRDTTSVLWPF